MKMCIRDRLEACYEQGTLKDNKYDILEKYRQKVSFITVDLSLIHILCLPLRTGTGHSFMGAGNDVFQNEYGT